MSGSNGGSAAPLPSLPNYSLTEKIGTGSYGSVYKAHFKNGAREVVAVKCVRKSGLSKHEVDNIVNEISLLKKLKHPHIVEMKEFAWDSNYIYIIMDYCGGGDLSHYIRNNCQLSEPVVKLFLQQLASALQYLRENNVSHMDLKPQNILLTGGSRPRLQLADFGFAQKFSTDQTKTSLRGSPLYMAPEMILKRKYDAKVDLWSTGVIMYECLFGRAPYKSSTVDELMVKIVDDAPISIPDSPKISDTCCDLLTRCLTRDPVSRIDYPEFFQHKFLDLEHMPTEESEARALSLLEGARKLEKDGLTAQALDAYRSALDFLVPLLRYEKSHAKRLELKKRVEDTVQKAERLKYPQAAPNASSVPRGLSRTTSSSQSSAIVLPKSSSFDDERVKELVRLCSVTPQLKTGLEIMQSAELYELEGQYSVALDKYQTALGIILPALSKEPKGQRKTLLHSETKGWMSRAEKVKEVIAIQEKVLSDSAIGSESNEKCVIS